jgi:hypothetical protein
VINKKWTNEAIAQALRESRGMPTIAARKLGCSYQTIRRAIKDTQYVAEVCDEAREQLADTAESTLALMAFGKRDRKKPDRWEIEPNITALIFLCKTHPALRARGYTERHEHEVGGELVIKIVNDRGMGDV